jgi:hypothetical protein
MVRTFRFGWPETGLALPRRDRMLSHILLPTIGVIILGVVGFDVFMTVFNPAEYGGPLTLRQNRVIWVIATRLSRHRKGQARHRALSVAAPIMALATIAIWIILLIVGFGLIYLPWMNTFLVSPGQLRAPLVEAFYFSASTATTLSIGDLVPNSAAFRILVPLETLAGVGLLTAVLQYILAISERAQSMATLALDIKVHFDGDHTPESVADQMRRSGDTRGWGEWCDQISRSLLELWEAHTRYPILLYFHPVDGSESLSAQLGMLLRLDRAIRNGTEPGPLVGHPGFEVMCRSLELYLLAVDRHFLPDVTAPEPRHQPDIDSAYRRLLRQTRYSAGEGHRSVAETGDPATEEDQRQSSKRSA